jgi:hypothetical protein
MRKKLEIIGAIAFSSPETKYQRNQHKMKMFGERETNE